MKKTLRAYYLLSKPGIVYGNAFTAVGGFFFGAMGSPDLLHFALMLVGISLVMASACAFNNVMDRDIDAVMERTKKRPVPSGAIPAAHALTYATVVLVVGLTLLLLVNQLTALVAIIGHFAYVVLYGYAKRTTVHGTLVGTLSGSTPPVIGYVAATGVFDFNALLLFLIMVAWQMPHFYTIAIFRLKDYQTANIPVLPAVKGFAATRRQMIAYTVLFVVACMALWIFGDASLLWALIMLLAGIYWLYLCLLPPDEPNKWAGKQFGWSLWLLVIMCAALTLDGFLTLEIIS